MNRFIIMVSQYNAVKFIKKCLDSIQNQDYKNYSVVVRDNGSTDGTWDIVKTYPFNLVRNDVRIEDYFSDGPRDINKFVSSKEDIIVLVSGDDYLHDDFVLSYLNEIYQDDIWFTYGQFVPLSGNYGPYCKPIPDIKTYRKSGLWITSHLLTFKKHLWDLIEDKDLRYNGSYTRYAGDRAIVYPMIEMAGKHVKFIDKVLYVYNDLNPSNISKVNPKESIEEAEYFIRQPSYREL